MNWLAKNNTTILSLIFVLILTALTVFVLGGSGYISLILLGITIVLSLLCLITNIKGPYEITAFCVATLFFFVILYCDSNTIETQVKGYLLHEWDWIALIVAASSLIFAACTYTSQEKTQNNTLQITPLSQLGLLIDLVRHSYMNIAVIYAVDGKMEELKKTLPTSEPYDIYYPSEEHIIKLRSDDTAISPAVFASDPARSGELQRFRFNLRNANLELEVVCKHLCDPDLVAEIKRRDIEMIKYRIDYNIQKIGEIMRKLWGKSPEEIARTVLDYVNINAAQKKSNDNDPDYTKLLTEADRYFGNSTGKYFYKGFKKDGKRTELLKLLFPRKEEESPTEEENKFLRRLNQNIYINMHKCNGKFIRLIPYKKINKVM